MTRVLVVEDEPDIASVLLDYLRHAGFEAEHIADGRAALARLLADPPDLTLLDIMLPGLDGLSILRQLQPGTTHPVILLTARVEELDRLLGLELGADDYICKPFSPREVVARVKTVLRRARPATAAPAAALLLNPQDWSARLLDQTLTLTKREFRLLQALARQPGRLFSRAQLLDLAYEDTQDVNERAVDSHIKNLRRKLAAAGPGREWIRSVYGVGFAFDPAPEPG
ncbi:response regulator [Pseudorhodoferax sp. LjRoot39]|uniref:response regulator n=1 Tax=Pseudorhodoferax sp. LjRoot39 TaxID=3342328 RepID=UPI003ED0E045